MMMRASLIVAASLTIAAPAAAASVAQRAVEAAMTDSATGWNGGDIKRFMAIYSTGAKTSFVTKEGVLRGKAVMTERYLTRYDFTNALKRGVLSFVTLDYRQLGPAHALYIGRYTLTYTDGKTQSGPTSLVFRRVAGKWRIIADHSG